jgi:hypothetical protein
MSNRMERSKRAQRRTAAREAAKLPAREIRRRKDSQLGFVLFCLGIAIAIIIVLAPPGTPTLTAVWLSALFAALLYPALRVSQWILPTSTRWITQTVAIVGLVCVLFPFGKWVWPHERHNLSNQERYAFERPLKEQKAPREKIQVACPQDDERACVYAAQFVDYFREAGWTVQGNLVERVMLARPLAGVILFKHGSGRLDPSNWRSGLWAALSPSLVSVYHAFVNIGIEPGSGPNPELPEGTITVYFGSEKSSPAESTALGAAIRRAEQARRAGVISGPN